MVDNSANYCLNKLDLDTEILSMYEDIEKKGKGRNFILYKAIDNETSQAVAIKKYHGCLSSNSESKAIYNEIIILEQLSDHSNVIFLENVVRSKCFSDIYLVFEYVDTNLKNVIFSNILKPIQIKFIAYQLALTLNYIHSANLLHMDIKPSNILLNENCEIKITDFGLSRLISGMNNETHESLSDFKTIRWYKSPEMLLGSMIIDPSSDYWSFACVLAEMVLGKPLFPGNSTLNQLDLILQIIGKPCEQDLKELENYMMATCLLDTINCKVKKNLKDILIEKESYSEDLYDLLCRILTFNPKKRLTFNQIIKHKYFEELFSVDDTVISEKKIDLEINSSLRREVKEYFMKSHEGKNNQSHFMNGDNNYN